MTISSAAIVQWVGAYLWPFVRISALFLAMPVFGSSFIPVRVRILLAVGCTLVIVPLLPPPPVADPLTVAGAIIGLQQALIGLSIGIVLQILMAIFLVGGQLIAIQMGIGFSTILDPINGEQTVTLGMLYLFLVTLIFINLDGHLLMLNLIAESFRTLPVSNNGPDLSAYWTMVEWGGKVFSGGTMVALPAVTALLLVNIAMGVMARAAPQMNLLSIGFSIYIFVGLFVIAFTLSTVLVQFQSYMFESISVSKILVKVP